MEILNLPTSNFVAKNMIIEYVSQDNDVYYKHVRIENEIPLESTAINKREVKKMLRRLADIKTEKTLEWQNYITPNNVHHYVPSENPTIVWSPNVNEKKKFLYDKDTYEIYYPKILFVLNNKSLYVFYYEGDLSSKTILRTAFLPNVYDSGNVCLGNTKHKQKIVTMNDYIDSYEKRFFDSVYNVFHMNTSNSTLPFVTFLEMSANAPVSVSYFKEINSYKDVLKNIV